MAIYTVHEPIRATTDAVVHAGRFRFVRDGFHFWAFLLPPLWMLWHRLWLVLMLWLAAMLAIDLGLRAAGVSAGPVFLIDTLVGLLVGLEASTLRRWTLGRRGWRMAGLVSAGDEEEAEQRFFERWTTQSAQIGTAAASSRPANAGQSRPAGEPGVLGLFPEPGVRP